MKRLLARIFHTCVAADVSRRRLRGAENALTDVGGYTPSVNLAEYEISWLRVFEFCNF